MTTILARFRTNERAMQAYRRLEGAVRVSLPQRRDGNYPWVLTIVYSLGEQHLVLDTVGRYGGVTFQED